METMSSGSYKQRTPNLVQSLPKFQCGTRLSIFSFGFLHSFFRRISYLRAFRVFPLGVLRFRGLTLARTHYGITAARLERKYAIRSGGAPNCWVEAFFRGLPLYPS
jgi:hypothetical protein